VRPGHLGGGDARWAGGRRRAAAAPPDGTAGPRCTGLTVARLGRITRLAAGIALGAGLALAAGAAPVHGQDNCLAPGETVTSVPWAQHQLAPTRAWPLSTGVGQRVAVVSSG